MYQKGCICLDDIPEDYISEYKGKDGKKKKYIHFHIYPLQEPVTILKNEREITYTHVMSLMPALFGKGKLQISQIEERVSPYDVKEQKKPKQTTKKETPSLDVSTNEVEDEDLF